MTKKSATTSRKSSSARKSSGGQAHKDLSPRNAERVKGGRMDGSLDAGVFFKYDIKGNKEG
jgi:hypothetical protein